MPMVFNPLLEFGFEEQGEQSFIMQDSEGNNIDITQYINSLNTEIAKKVNIFQGSNSANRVVITDPQGNITTVEGVVMNSAEREKLANLNNIMLLKGILNSYEALYQVDNPQVGWCYYVKFDNGENDNVYEEYVYTADHGWEMFGHFNADKIPQYLGGSAVDIDNRYRVNIKYDPDLFEIDGDNRLRLRDLSYVAKCSTLTEINALANGSIFHYQGTNNENIAVVDTDGTNTFIQFGYFYKKEENSIKRINKDGSAAAIKAGIATEITNGSVSVKFDPNFLMVDEFGRLTLKYKIRAWDELDGESGSGGSGSSGQGGGEQSVSGICLKQVADLDNYEGQEGEIVQYVGTSGTYINGYIYIRENSVWKQKNVQPEPETNNWINI